MGPAGTRLDRPCSPPARQQRHPAQLTTRHDRPADWLRAGRALQHTLLLLTLHGLRASLMHQALEWPDLRGRMTDPLPDRCAPQMLIRIGYGPAGFPTPRLRTATLIEEHGLAPSTAR